MLVKSIFIAYCIAMVFIFVNVFLIWYLRMLKLFTMLVMEGVKVVTLAPTTMTMRASTFQLNVLISSICDWYKSILMAYGGESAIWCHWESNGLNGEIGINVGVGGGVGERRGGASYGRALIHSISDLRRVLQWHLWVLHVHGRSHGTTIFSWRLS